MANKKQLQELQEIHRIITNRIRRLDPSDKMQMELLEVYLTFALLLDYIMEH